METKEKKTKKGLSKIEKAIKRHHYKLELIRTVVPCCVLVLQIIMICKLFHLM
jgi:hypothetical protein